LYFNFEGAKKMVMSTMEKLYTEGMKTGEMRGKMLGEIICEMNDETIGINNDIMRSIKRGIMRGIEKSESKTKIQLILKALSIRFNSVPASMEKAVKSYKYTFALDSLFEKALVCKTLQEFKKHLTH
jgi:hypothetical protein